MNTIKTILTDLEASGNMRHIATDDAPSTMVDLSSNDYLGIAQNTELASNYLSTVHPENFTLGSAASRLLASRQHDYTNLESALEDAYGRPALLFNSGYHANTGIVGALADKHTLFVADKLVHASIIDGLNLASAAGATFVRFRHNDTAHLQRILEKNRGNFDRIVIIVESVYSMDGDSPDLRAIADLKKATPGAMLYVDEAHAVGVLGPAGLGMSVAQGLLDDVDVMVGTFGKALASTGAYAIVSDEMKAYLTNRARSLIFSTSLPAIVTGWSLTTFSHALADDDARTRLRAASSTLADILGTPIPSHIQPLIIGDAHRAVALSHQLADAGYHVMAIRTPTVPAGTERLRFSLSAALTPATLAALRPHLPTPY